jgi:Zn-dependent M16 (insulinase) family peptidase
VKPEDVDKVEALVIASLEKAVAEGFDKDAIKAAMNGLEFNLREFNTGSFPRGLSLMLGLLSQWIYDRDPFSGVRFESALKELKDDIAAGKPIFQELITKYVLSNDHRVTVEAKPDVDLEARTIARETGEFITKIQLPRCIVILCTLVRCVIISEGIA